MEVRIDVCSGGIFSVNDSDSGKCHAWVHVDTESVVSRRTITVRRLGYLACCSDFPSLLLSCLASDYLVLGAKSKIWRLYREEVGE